MSVANGCWLGQWARVAGRGHEDMGPGLDLVAVAWGERHGRGVRPVVVYRDDSTPPRARYRARLGSLDVPVALVVTAGAGDDLGGWPTEKQALECVRAYMEGV